MISRRFQVPSAKPQAIQEVHFIKAGHRYSFRYEAGREVNLVCAILATAVDERTNLDLEDARKIMDGLGLPTTT
ncbi:MAG: hypothetical protein L6R28_24200 [Planctomycetes bacterium]|nr:hypothetical protein [Planctomycetota bacterium]